MRNTKVYNIQQEHRVCFIIIITYTKKLHEHDPILLDRGRGQSPLMLHDIYKTSIRIADELLA